jgi:hypothetical protein
METVVKEEDLGVMSPLRTVYSDRMFMLLAESLNDIHQLNHSKRFWMLITEEYVRAVMSRKELMERDPFVAVPGLYPLVGHDIPGQLQKIKRGAGKVVRHLKDHKNRVNIHHAIRNNDVLRVGFQGIDRFEEEVGGVELPDQELAVAGPGNRNLRSRVEEIAGQETDLFMKNAILGIPKIFVEHFRKLYDSVTLFDPASKTFHVMGKFKFGRRQLTIARYIEEGAQLVWYQDGAFIGEVQNKYSRYLAHSVADEYRTWGWMLTEKDRPGFLKNSGNGTKIADKKKQMIC